MVIVLGLLIIIAIGIDGLLIVFGCRLCSKNNALGILLLFISLNVFGLILGVALLYNFKNKTTVENEITVENKTTVFTREQLLNYWEEKDKEEN